LSSVKEKKRYGEIFKYYFGPLFQATNTKNVMQTADTELKARIVDS